MVDNTVPWRPGPIRALLAARPAAFRSLIDVERGAYGPKVGCAVGRPRRRVADDGQDQQMLRDLDHHR